MADHFAQLKIQQSLLSIAEEEESNDAESSSSESEILGNLELVKVRRKRLNKIIFWNLIFCFLQKFMKFDDDIREQSIMDDIEFDKEYDVQLCNVI